PFTAAVAGGWRTTTPPLRTELGLSDASAAAPPGAARGQAIVVGRSSGTGATLLPAALVRSLPSAPRGEAVKLGNLQAYRYRRLRPAGAPVTTIVAAPTASDGVATVACVGEAVQASCDRVAASLRAKGVEPVALGPHPAYAEAVDRALSRLAHARAAAPGRIREAKSRRAQGAVARDVSRAYARAGASLRRAPITPAERDTNAALLTALGRAGAAWRSLGNAAAHGDARGYTTARATIARREAALRQAMSALRALGYEVR
ncbi:MAG TPA: hypothetical protein VNT03_00405, partial [Baekduia sp.]|nr:hypothetical protein [Baekduia sp.]